MKDNSTSDDEMLAILEALGITEERLLEILARINSEKARETDEFKIPLLEREAKNIKWLLRLRYAKYGFISDKDLKARGVDCKGDPE